MPDAETNHAQDKGNLEAPLVADAALDRIVHAAHQINLKGESIRKKRSTLTKEGNSDN